MKQNNHFIQILKLQFFRSGGTLVFFTIIQVMISLGIAVGYTYMFATPGQDTMLYLATGAPTIVVIMAGLVTLPMQNSTAKLEGYNEFLRTLPTNRFNIIAADTLIWICITLPGIIISTLVVHFVYHPGYSFSLAVIPSFFLVVLTSIGVGYGFSFVMQPQMAQALSQVLGFGALMFSPINYPMERLPEWLQVVHKILPIDAMAKVMRASMASTTFEVGIQEYVRLAIWCVIGYLGAVYALNKTR